MKVGDKVYHRINPGAAGMMMVIDLEKGVAGTKFKCRYNSRQKTFDEKWFLEKELVLIDEYNKPFKNTKEEIQYWKDSIVCAQDALKRAEQRLEIELKSK